MNGITYIEHFIENPSGLFNLLQSTVIWDERMSARKTASFGKAYNYSQMEYVHQAFTPILNGITLDIEDVLHFKPNNCLMNYYMDGTSKMGFHSDQTDILEAGTGVGIISLGATRILRFRSIEDKNITKDFSLPSGSFIYMTNEVQAHWQHAIPTSDATEGRISMTFRKIK
ncbi:alpha-ketoglutarate-dependent dioxygenase AlkB [uncultured Dokdonia sp.]|uniref:alpha-ketoglutarate-dependent dioxygenase AlkB n=1 Tax=uncultured Dokdonia sp. TaxID=575653 RepID=UPI002615F9C4|nr:alpha-ketoglutarate-dependent dioxygenase AlkB [uncultured Dokdonia sp.]